MNVKSFVALFFLWLTTQAHALSFDQALDLAIGYDKKYASAIFEARSAEYVPVIGRSGLMPKVTLTGFQAGNKLSQSQADFFGQPTTTQQNYTSQSYAAQLTQPLLNLAAIATYLQSTKQEKAAQQKLAIEFNELKTRVIDAYCALALAQEVYAQTAKELVTYTAQEKIASARLLHGASSKTDVDEIIYAKLQTQATLDEANNAMLQAKIALEKLLGFEIAINEPMTMPLSYLSPNTKLESLLLSAKDGNPKILYQKYQLDSADYENQKNKAAYIPTVDIVGYQGYQNSNTISTVGQKSTQGYLGLQLNIPLVTGGETYGKERQSALYAQSQRMLLESEVNDVEESVKKLYSQAQTSGEKISTLKLQTKTAEQLYLSFLKQQELGLKSNYDLLMATRRKFQSDRDLAKAKYEKIQALKRLEVVASDVFHIK